MDKTYSPVINVVKTVCDKSKLPDKSSKDQFHAIMRDSLELCIKSLMPFEINDFKNISETIRYFPWNCWNNSNYGEEYYRIAVINNNISAAISFENWKGRKPFIHKGFVKYPERYGRYGSIERHTSRLFIGASYYDINKLERVTVTSFDDKNGIVICCSYQNEDENKRSGQPLKIKHLYKFDHQYIKSLRA